MTLSDFIILDLCQLATGVNSLYLINDSRLNRREFATADAASDADCNIDAIRVCCCIQMLL